MPRCCNTAQRRYSNGSFLVTIAKQCCFLQDSIISTAAKRCATAQVSVKVILGHLLERTFLLAGGWEAAGAAAGTLRFLLRVAGARGTVALQLLAAGLVGISVFFDCAALCFPLLPWGNCFGHGRLKGCMACTCRYK